MAWLSGWSHRKTVSITGQTGAGTNYQVDFSIGDGSGGDFHLESHCTSFPNDIQVTDNDQTTPLDYWVEDLTLDPITMWVEVADDLGSNVDICVYYGKSGESSARNGDNTFLFFDDFPGSSLDTTKWDTISGSSSVSGGILSLGSGSPGSKIRTKSSFSGNIAIFSRMRGDISTPYYTQHKWWYSSTTHTVIYLRPQDDLIHLYDTDLVDQYTQSFANAVYYNIEDRIDGTSWKGFIDGVQKASVTTTASDVPSMQIEERNGWRDYVRVRKYIVSEPAFSSAGSEESAPARSHGYIF